MSSNKSPTGGDDDTTTLVSSSRESKTDIDSAISSLLRLAIRTIVIVTAAWIGIFFFETYFATGFGIQHFHIQITSSALTIAIAFLVINSIRRIFLKFVSKKISHHISSTISFFAIILISILAAISLLHQWDINPQAVLVGGGVTAVIIGVALSTIVGNILSGGLVLTAFPAKIGDSVFVVSDNLRGTIDEVNLLYTKIRTTQGSEYFVPNSAIVQGIIRMVKEPLNRQDQHQRLQEADDNHNIGDGSDDALSISLGDFIELSGKTGSLSSLSPLYAGRVSKITPKFITLVSNDKYDNNMEKEIIVPRKLISSAEFVIEIAKDGKKTIERHKAGLNKPTVDDADG